MNAWTIAQNESLLTAENKGKHWTTWELELVSETMSAKTAEVADLLERTVYAVSTMRGLIRDGYTVSQLIDGPRAEIVREKICPACNLVQPATGCC